MNMQKPKPTPGQLEFLNWEFGAFFHFGIRTFYEGHKDWDMLPMPLEGFMPTELDCEQWIQTVKKAGAKYAILVTKHHDGFANWPSKYTGYSVAGTPWKDGKGDVVAEYVAACRKYGLKVGLYYSPAEFGLKESKKTEREYDDYFINQIGELLSGYGKIDYLWFDGCGSEGHQYDTVRIIREIRTMQPEILIFNMWDPDTRWIGNESGIAPWPCFNTVDAVDFSVRTDQADTLGAKKFLPAECDFRIRRENWFYSDSDEHTVKTPDELMGLYDYSVGRGCNFLINIGPDRRGLLPQKDKESLLAFGEQLKKRFSKPVADFKDFIKEGDRYICRFKEPVLVDHVVLSEDLTEGEAILSFSVLIQPYYYGKIMSVYEGKSVGHKAICRFPTIMTTEIIIDITKSDGDYAAADIKAYYTKA